MNPILCVFKTPSFVPWGRVTGTCTGTALLLTLACRDDWRASSTIALWLVLQWLIWCTVKK
jgi:hypothetical protein